MTVADDEAAAIVVKAKKVDEYGDVGYVLDITNRTESKVYVYSGLEWTVGDREVGDPALLATVDPGETVESFMWFDREEGAVSSIDDLQEVQGTICIEDFDTSKRVATYVFKM